MTAERPDRSDARLAILEAVDKHDDGGDDTAQIGDVVDDAVGHVAGPSTIFEAFAALFKQGEVYEPEPGHVRRTGGVRDPDDSNDAPSLTGGDK